MVSMLLALVVTGCATPPVFMGVEAITVNTQTAAGVHKVVLEGEQLAEAAACLDSTVEILPDQQAQDAVLQEILLMNVKDRLGDRMFELTTNENFSGNKGKLYRNTCIYRIIKSGPH